MLPLYFKLILYAIILHFTTSFFLFYYYYYVVVVVGVGRKWVLVGNFVPMTAGLGLPLNPRCPFFSSFLSTPHQPITPYGQYILAAIYPLSEQGTLPDDMVTDACR